MSVLAEGLRLTQSTSPLCRLPPDDVVPEGGELLDTEYILAPGAALMLDAVIRPTQPLTSGPGGVSAALRASQVYERLGQP